MKSLLIILLSLASSGCANVPQARRDTSAFKSCQEDHTRQAQRSQELRRLAKEDQDDRQGPYDAIDWPKVLVRDENRRKRVGEIFAEGCFQTAADYSAAALIYQHGNVPDHFFQAFLWS